MSNIITVHTRLYLLNVAASPPLDELTSTLAAYDTRVPTHVQDHNPLPYIDLQHGTLGRVPELVRNLWNTYSAHLHSLWLRTSDGFNPDALRVVRGGGVRAARTEATYLFDRVHIEWHGVRTGTTSQRLAVPGVYTASNHRHTSDTDRSPYGTVTTVSYGIPTTVDDVLASIHRQGAILRGEDVRPANTKRVIFSYRGHRVRVLHTFTNADGRPAWQDYALDTWDNVGQVAYRTYHADYCGL
ncbi:MAG: hypothetical protein AAF125_04980 [Chloroflexota bacterium]